MKSYNQPYQRKQKSHTNIVMRALIVSWTIIFAGVWWVFFRSKPTPPTNIIDPNTNSGTVAEDTKTTYYMGEKILASGVLTPTESFTTYTHDFVSDKGDVFGLKSKDIDLYTFEGKVQLKGSITDFKNDLPIISVAEIIADKSTNIADDEIHDNPDYYMFEDKGVGFDLSISEGYTVQQKANGNLVLVDETTDNTEVLTVNTFACTPGDSAKDCTALKQRFIDIGSNNFVSSNNITFYNLTETITWIAFHPSGEFGYYITPSEEKNLAAFANLMSFIDEDAFAIALQEELPDVCKNLDYSITEVEDIAFVYKDNGMVQATLTTETNDGATLTCVVAIRLGDSLKIIPLSFDAVGGTEESPQDAEEENNEDDVQIDEQEDAEEVIEKEEAQATITAPDTGVSELPENWTGAGWFQYSSVRGYDVYFSNKSISYAGEILSTAEEIAPGVICSYKINVIQWKRADEIDSNPDMAVYECIGDEINTDIFQTVGSAGGKVFVAEWYTNNLGDTKIIVE